MNRAVGIQDENWFLFENRAVGIQDQNWFCLIADMVWAEGALPQFNSHFLFKIKTRDELFNFHFDIPFSCIVPPFSGSFLERPVLCYNDNGNPFFYRTTFQIEALKVNILGQWIYTLWKVPYDVH